MYPDDSLQSLIENWWIKEEEPSLQRGSLLWAYLPHVDQQPYVLVPEGRKNATEHSTADYSVEPLKFKHPPRHPTLPVAGLPFYEGEIRAVYRAKRRPALVVGLGGVAVEKKLRTGGARYQTTQALTVIPYYGIDQGGSRGGWRPEFVDRIRHCEYPQYMWEMLPLGGKTSQSILRFDHLQPLADHAEGYQLAGIHLGDDAMKIVDEWLGWVLYGTLPTEGVLNTARDMLGEL